MMATDQRQGDWIETYTGKQFWPLDPRSDEVDLEDIAHSLSQQSRFTGHVCHFYSVGQHSLNCLTLARNYRITNDPVVLFWILMHDAAEAYIGDIARPTKHYPTLHAIFKPIETAIQAVIWQRFGVESPEGEWLDVIKRFDNLMLGHEGRMLMHNTTDWAGRFDHLLYGVGIDVRETSWAQVKARFMAEVWTLLAEISKERALVAGGVA